MDTKPGPWELLVFPQYLQPEIVHVIVQLVEHGDVMMLVRQFATIPTRSAFLG